MQKKKSHNILALTTCAFIIFASFWCMSLPQDRLQEELFDVLASKEEASVIKLNPGSWDLEGENNLKIEGNESGVTAGEDGQTIYTAEENGLMGFLNHTVSFALLTIGSLSILGVVVGGIMIIIGSMQGKEDGIAFGKDAVKYSLIGLALIFLSYFLVSVVQTILYG